MDAPLVIIGTGMAGFALLRAVRHADARRAIWMAGADEAAVYAKFDLPQALASGREAGELVLATAEQVAYRYGATVRPRCRVQAIDRARRVILTDAGEQPYAHLVLATGADAVRPAGVRGAAAGRLLTVASLAEYTYLRRELAGRRRIAVLGGGVTGCELAASLVRGGFEVTLLEPGNRLLRDSYPHLCAERIANAMQAAGLRLRVEDGIQRIDPGAGALELTSLSGQRLPVEVVVAALGSHPRTTLAQGAGLAVGAGIVVDARLCTSDPDIYALGECAEHAGHVFRQADEIEASAATLADVLRGRASRLNASARMRRLRVPGCEAVLCAPPEQVAGEWHETANRRGVRALFEDRHGRLRGFALVGDAAAEADRLFGRVVGPRGR